MTADARSQDLQDQLRRVAGLCADTAEQSARVHDDVAEVHDGLGDRLQLDPAQLRAHAARDRAFADAERRVASGETPTTALRPDAPG